MAFYKQITKVSGFWKQISSHRFWGNFGLDFWPSIVQAESWNSACWSRRLLEQSSVKSLCRLQIPGQSSLCTVSQDPCEVWGLESYGWADSGPPLEAGLSQQRHQACLTDGRSLETPLSCSPFFPNSVRPKIKDPDCFMCILCLNFSSVTNGINNINTNVCWQQALGCVSLLLL